MWTRVEEEELKNRVMWALGNLNLRRILISCSSEARAVSSLAAEFNLPLSTTYNYVHELVAAGLLAVERIILTDEGNRYEVYRSLAREVRTLIGSNGMFVEVLPNEDTASRFFRLWSSLKKVK